MPHMNAITNHQPLALMEHRRMGGVMVGPIGAARHNNTNWRLGGFHGADLHRRGVGAQNLALSLGIGRQIESVMFLARRMLFGDVQRGEVVMVGFDIRPLGNGKSHLGKDRHDLFNRSRQRMKPCLGLGA